MSLNLLDKLLEDPEQKITMARVDAKRGKKEMKAALYRDNHRVALRCKLLAGCYNRLGTGHPHV